MYKKIKPTVKDVAKRAGVSPSTVSRVISNNPKISKATRDRVLKEMEVLQFQPMPLRDHWHGQERILLAS